MVLPHETLTALSSISGFEPSKINDPIRTDLTDGPPFLAIDGPNPHEVDDAIRISRLKTGGFLVEVAIADGAQLSGDSNEKLIERAINRRETEYYGQEATRKILPISVTKQLSLGTGENPALVISQVFSREGENLGDIDIFPALVSVKGIQYREFGYEYLVDKTPRGIAYDYAAFYTDFRRWRGLKEKDLDPRSAEGGLAGFGIRIVSTAMVVANIAVARWSVDADVPILYREFTPRDLEEPDERPIFAGYNSEPIPHHGLPGFKEGIGYTHATSPLRRTADLVNHLQIGHALAGQKPVFSSSMLNLIGDRLSCREEVKVA